MHPWDRHEIQIRAAGIIAAQRQVANFPGPGAGLGTAGYSHAGDRHAKISRLGAAAKMFRKILIANRGEIAVRLGRACRDIGARSVAVFSDAGRASLHVRVGDGAYPIGPAPSRESYLVIEKIIGVARYAGCDALHPGYGFLAENPALARACTEAC